MDTSKKEPPSAFSLYRDDILQSVKRDNPDLRPNEITKLIAQKWVKCDETTRKEYEQKHQEYKDKFEQEKKTKSLFNNIFLDSHKKQATSMDILNMLGGGFGLAHPSANQIYVSNVQDKLTQLIAKSQKQKGVGLGLPPANLIGTSQVQDIFNKLIARPQKQKEEKIPVEKAVSAFTLFKNDIMQETKKENPDCPAKELTQLIAQKWVLSGEEVHKTYEKKLQELQLAEADPLEEAKENINKMQNPESYDSYDEEERYKDYPESEDEEYDEEESHEEESYEDEYYETEEELKSYTFENQSVSPLERNLEITKKNKEEPLTAYTLFKNDNLEETQKENPEYSMSEILRIVALKWTLSDENIKKKYENMRLNK